jgi:hypothetical protein
LNGIVVGKVKNGILIKFGNHGYSSISSGGGNVLSESIPISAAGWLGNGGKQLGAIEWCGEIGMVASGYLGFNFFCKDGLGLPVFQHSTHGGANCWIY